LLLNRSLLNNLSDWDLLSLSLGRDRSILDSGLGLWSCFLWLVVNWLLLGILSCKWSLGGVLWINFSLLLEIRFVRFELLSFLKVSSSLPVVVHVSELIMDHLDLLVGQAVRLSVDQALNGSELVNENKFWIVSVVVDSIKVSLKKLVVQIVGRSLSY